MNNYDIFCISSRIHGQTVAKAQLSGTSSGGTPWNWPPSGIVSLAEPEPCCLWCSKKPLSLSPTSETPCGGVRRLTWLLCVVEGDLRDRLLKRKKSFCQSFSFSFTSHLMPQSYPVFYIPKTYCNGYLLVLSSPDYVSIFSRFLSQLLSTHLLVSFQMFAKISDGLFILLSTYLYSCMLLPPSFLYCRLMGIQGRNFLCTVYYF